MVKHNPADYWCACEKCRAARNEEDSPRVPVRVIRPVIDGHEATFPWQRVADLIKDRNEQYADDRD